MGVENSWGGKILRVVTERAYGFGVRNHPAEGTKKERLKKI